MHIVLGPTPSKTGATPRKQASRHTAREKHLVEQKFIKAHNVCYRSMLFDSMLSCIQWTSKYNFKIGNSF